MAKPEPKRQRARDDADKLARKQQILRAARAVFSSSAFDTVTVSEIARRAKLAKGTVYLYFETKEELFLTLLVSDFEAWLDQVEAELVRRMSSEAVARVLASSLTARPELVRLICLMHGVLEHNLPLEVAVRFKRTLLALSGRLGAALLRVRPSLAPERAVSLVVRAFALVVGLGQMSDPSKVMLRAIDSLPELAPFRVDLGRELEEGLFALLKHAEHKPVARSGEET